MLVTAFWTVNPFTNTLEHSWTLANFQPALHRHLPDDHRAHPRDGRAGHGHRRRAGAARSPTTWPGSRRPRGRQLLFTAVLLPLWASYLARVYAWIVILQKGGTLSWVFTKIGLGAVNIGYTNTAMWLVFSYIWLPFMIVPVYGALERIPDSLLEASGDLGRAQLAHAAQRAAAARAARRGGRLDLHLLADPGRLHHAAARGRGQLQLHRQRHLLEHRHRGQPAVRGGPGASCRS